MSVGPYRDVPHPSHCGNRRHTTDVCCCLLLCCCSGPTATEGSLRAPETKKHFCSCCAVATMMMMMENYYQVTFCSWFFHVFLQERQEAVRSSIRRCRAQQGSWIERTSTTTLGSIIDSPCFLRKDAIHPTIVSHHIHNPLLLPCGTNDWMFAAVVVAM